MSKRLTCRVKKSCTWQASRSEQHQRDRLVHEFQHYAGFSEQRARAAVERLTLLVGRMR